MSQKFLKEKQEIINWLDTHGVQFYTLVEDEEYGYVINAGLDVNISNQNLDTIAVKFNIVEGSFFCSYNNLTSLEGCPNEVLSGQFDCSYNNLTNLEFSPKEFRGKFYCMSNYITSLKGSPRKMTELHAQNNLLKDINVEDLPDIVTRKIYLHQNKDLEELQHIDKLNILRHAIVVKKEKSILNQFIKEKDTNKNIIKL